MEAPGKASFPCSAVSTGASVIEKGGRMTDSSNSVTFDIVKHIGVISSYPSGWSKELNRVSWNGNPAKLDIREWDEQHRYASRGTTLHDSEARRLALLLLKELGE